MTIPRLLITDQRYGGTRRYYKDLITSYHNYENIESNSDSMETIDNPIDDYFTKFWRDELQYEIKSGVTPHKDTNKYGVHLLTANTIPTKLFNNMEQQPQSTQHALVLFTTSTCGHCKRIWTIWNRLSHVLQNIKWDTFLQLYHIDVSQNDIAATPLNVTVEWIPEVYYLSPDRTKRIRYNITDELGDGIGGIREPYEIIHWLINDVGNNFKDEDGIKQLLYDLEQLGNESEG